MTDAQLLELPILSSSKTLELNRIGKISGYSFFRMSNKKGILKTVSEMLNNKITVSLTLKVFNTLDNGNLSISLEEYLEEIKTNLFPRGLLELLCINTGVNFAVVDFKNKSFTLYQNNNTNNCYLMNLNYEPIIKIENNKIIRIFNINELKIFKQNKTNLQILNEKLKIKSQFVVEHKVLYINTDYGIIPVSDSGANPNLSITHIFNFKLIDPLSQLKFLEKLGFKIVSQYFSETENVMNGLITSNNILIPTIPTTILKGLKLVFKQFVPNINNEINNEIINYGNKIDTYLAIESRLRYQLNFFTFPETEKKLIELINNLIIIVPEYTVKDIPNIKRNCSSKSSKEHIDPFCLNGKLKVPKIYLKSIINKILNDIKYKTPDGKLLILGQVPKELFNKNEFIKRSNENIVIKS
jgi:hypothetical protein